MMVNKLERRDCSSARSRGRELKEAKTQSPDCEYGVSVSNHRIEREMQSFDFSPRATFVSKIADEPNRDLVFNPSAVELSRSSKMEHPCLALNPSFLL